MKLHRFGKRGGALAAVAVVALAVGAGAAFGTASGSAGKARSAKTAPPVCAKVGNVPASVKVPANCRWVTPNSPASKNPTSGPSFRSIGALVQTDPNPADNTCPVGVSGLGVICHDLGGGVFE